MLPIRRSVFSVVDFRFFFFVPVIAATLFAPAEAFAAISCARTVTANVVALDQPIVYNRLGASNVNGQVFALARDVINKTTRVPLNVDPAGAVAGNVEFRPDRRLRPLVLRVRTGDCLNVTLTNLLSSAANPNNILPANTPPIAVFIDEQVADRNVSFHANGLQLVGSIADDGSMTGKNAGSLVAPGASHTYSLYAEKEGVFLAYSLGATVGSDANQGHTGSGLFGQVIVEPKGARIYRSQVTDEELRLASTGATITGQPKINYEATYPNDCAVNGVWCQEGKAGLPILNMINPANNEIVHSAIEAIIAGPNADGTFPASTYPLESVGKRNPALPNRLEPFRDFASVWHDEPGTAQAFPGFYVQDPVFRYVLAGVKDGFMINYGSGGIGSEIIANRLGVGPMHDCLSCAYEEFFLTAYTVGDPAMLANVPANLGLEALLPGQAPAVGATGPKATFALYPEDPANVHHSYTGDFVKFRNTHVGAEQHVFHLHNHQWIYNPNDDNGNYLDAQGIGPGVGYTYEINYGGSGNRNKTAGDAIFHCHFYPHFAQGMWYMWRIHDTYEAGTRLAVSGGTGFHATPFALMDGTPAAGARALPDGEIVAGVPIPAVVPLPGKAMAPMPGAVEVVPNPLTTTASLFHAEAPGAVVPVGSLAKVIERNKNPGYPFWIAGIEEIVGQRPPTPPLDMLDEAMATALKASGDPLWANINPAQAGGFDGGLRRHAMHGVAAGGAAVSTVSPIDFSKVMTSAKPQYYPEDGTDVEKVAMAFHAKRNHPSTAINLDGSVNETASFVANGALPAVGAPYMEPCIDDAGRRMGAGVIGQFFGGKSLTDMTTYGSSAFSADSPRIYKGTNIQFDAVLTKTGYHNPQQRIVALWDDAVPIINKQKPPEPLVMRLNTFDCAVFWHSNLVPEYYEMDDYQVRTPTDIIGQHIHLPKWDLTTADGSANGWNYEDGTFSPGTVRERIHAVRHFNHCVAGDPRDNTDACPVEKAHPYWGQFGREDWIGARTTLQRWFADPLVNVAGVDRGLGIIFTHDHYGPSTHQQIGLYATVLVEPAGSTWAHNETGAPLGAGPNGTGGRHDGGPTSWQAMILPPTAPIAGNTVASETVKAHREFYFEFSDFQHAYEKGVYVGAGPDGRPLPGATPLDRFTGVATIQDAFRHAINPPARLQFNGPLYPDVTFEVAGGQMLGCPTRPCPQAIDVEDPGMLVVNYRAEPIALRVFDPNKLGPDGKPGTQADGLAGDLAFALATETTSATGVVTPLTRVIPELNLSESQLAFWTTPLISPAAVKPNDPFTPMLRAYQGDNIRVKIQAGGHEEEHNASLHGLKWLQGGSGFGTAPNSGWRGSQAAGISEQFTFDMPEIVLPKTAKGTKDYLYNIDSSMDGWWSGTWGLLRAYNAIQPDLPVLPNNVNVKPDRIVNKADFVGVCPITAPVVNQSVVAILANDLLPNPAGVTIVPNDPALATQHVGGALNPVGGTLVYNPRNTVIPPVTVGEDGDVVTIGGHAGPLHDPTAMLYVRLEDLVPVNPAVAACKGTKTVPGVANPLCAVKLRDGQKPEPLMLRAAAGSCMNVTLFNRLPEVAPDLPTLGTMMGVVKRDRNAINGGVNVGSIPFDNNLIRPSSHVGLAPQLLAHDISLDGGVNIGINTTQTVGPVVGGKLAKVETYSWYVGDIKGVPEGAGIRLVATPVEFGGFGLLPADKVKQGQKSLMGGFVALPKGATWLEDAGQHAAATVSANGKTYRDMMVVMAKDLNHRYADGAAVEHISGEGMGIPEDSQDNSAMALNYGIEPLWFRFGIAPNAPFGNAGCGTGLCFGSVAKAHEAYSNVLTGGADPVTPVFTVAAGQEARMHVAVPHGTSRGSTFAIHGHVWQRDPYVCPGDARNGLTGACNMTSVGSQALGNNPQGFAQGAQESHTPMGHFSYLLPSAGGGNGVKGDYLFRDTGAPGNAAGLWGILRVQ